MEPENLTQVFCVESYNMYKINHLTELITYSMEKDRIIYPDSSIDKYINIEDKIIINVYEVLNTNGMQLLYNKENSKDEVVMNLYTYLLKSKMNSEFRYEKIYYSTDHFHLFFWKSYKFQNNFKIKDNKEKDEFITENKIIEHKKETNILSLKESMVYFRRGIINYETSQSRKVITEFEIPIFHYYRSKKKSQYLFRDFIHEKISQFPVQ